MLDRDCENYTIKFSIKYQTSPGQNIYIMGNINELGNWKENKFKLKWSNSHTWKGTLELPECIKHFSYKFVCISDNGNYKRWEEGPDRIFHRDLFCYKSEKKIKMDCVWEHFGITFNIFYPLKNEFEYFQIIGRPRPLGGWFKEGGTPVKMNLSEPKTIEDSAIWEREPNRKLKILTEYSTIQNDDLIKDVYSQVGREIEILANSHVEKLDVNFVSELKFDKIGDYNIFIGPYPQNEEDIVILSKSDVTAVLNMQTDLDMLHRQINWKTNLEAYKKHGIEIVRYPIKDFDAEDLKINLIEAAVRLKELLQEGKSVYVHCTAGMSRAAATVISYLVFNHDYSLDDAYEYVKFYRNIICPNMTVLSEVLSYYKN